MTELNVLPNVEALNIDNIQVVKAEPVLEVVSDFEKKNTDSKVDAFPEASAPPESNNVLSDYISNDLINENMFNMTEIKNALLNALKIEFCKLLTMELNDNQAESLRNQVIELKKSKLFKLKEEFTLPDTLTLKDEIVVHTLSKEIERLSDKKLWKEHLMIDLAGKALNTIDCSLSIEKRVSNVKSK